jgi:tyrosyl-tRNA synthetase
LTTSAGIKMGKTHKGAIWLDPELTSPYDYYQYWINQDDPDIQKFLALFTLLPMDEVLRLGALEGARIREAKEVLAYEATALCHGAGEADLARKASRELFGHAETDPSNAAPTFMIENEELDPGIPAYVLFEMVGLCKSRGEARRLIAQGGGYLNHRRIGVFDQTISTKDKKNEALLLRAGKKKYMKIITE